MNAATRLLGAALGVALLAGCGSAGGPGGGVAGALGPREWAVAEDPDATPAEIVEAGGPSDVAVSGDQRVVTWQVQPEDDEGAHQGAWRLHDADGETVAEGGFGIVREQGAGIGVRAVPDGFVLESYTEPALWHLDRDGTLEEVARLRERRTTQPGDVLVRVPGGEADLVYRPSDRTAAPLPRVPTDNPQSIVLDETGAVSVLLPWGARGGARVATSPDGVAAWTTASLPLPRGDYPVIEMRAEDDRLLLLSARAAGGTPEGRVVAVWSRPVEPGGTWTSVPYDGDRLEDFDGATPGALDGRLLVTSFSKGAWIEQEAGSGAGFEALDLPAEEATVQVVGDALYALDGQRHALWVSDDLGRDWEEVER